MELYEKIPDEKIDVKIRMLETAFYDSVFYRVHKEGHIGEFGRFDEPYIFTRKYLYFLVGFQVVEVELLAGEDERLMLEERTTFKCLKCGRGVMHDRENRYWCFGCGDTDEFTGKS